MTIQRFHITAADAKRAGLAEFDLDRLGRFVVLAGPNGGGKSRVLARLEDSADMEEMNAQHYDDLKGQISRAELFLTGGADDQYDIEHARLKEQAAEARPRVHYADGFRPQILRFVPGPLQDVDLLRVTDGELQESTSRVEQALMQDIAAHAMNYVYWHLRRGLNAEHPRFAGTEQAMEYVAARDSLLDLAQTMVGVEFSLDLNNALLIDGIFYRNAPLSQGQKVLLQLAVAIHAKAKRLSGTILLLDEPETHLHPMVLVEVLKRLESTLSVGQFWIATHSVPLIAYIASREPSAIYYVDKGVVKYAERDPDLVLNGLLGGREGIDQLHHLTGLPADLAMIGYAAQCLAPPSVVGHREADPQEKQIVGLLRPESGHALRVLDIGAGKGRLLRALGHGMKDVDSRLDYFAVDKFDGDKQECLQAMHAYYPKSKERWFSSFEELDSAGVGPVDVAVLCNVLHEIPPPEWPALLHETASRLKPEGRLLIVEDQEIKVGELPHPGGFLVLDTQDLELLCPAIEAGSAAIDCHTHQGNERLKAHFIPKDRLLSVTDESVRLAVGSVERWAGDQIRHVRASASGGYRAALRYSFLLQQYTNARLYLADNPRPSEPSV